MAPDHTLPLVSSAYALLLHQCLASGACAGFRDDRGFRLRDRKSSCRVKSPTSLTSYPNFPFSVIREMDAYSIQDKLFSLVQGFLPVLLSVVDQSSKAFEGGVIREAPGSPLLHPSSRSTQLTWVPAGSILCQHSTHERSRPDQLGLHRASSSVNVLIRQKMCECWVFSLGLPQVPELSTASSLVPSLPSHTCTGRTPHIQPPAATTQMEARFPVLSDPQTHLGLLSSTPTPQSREMLRPPPIPFQSRGEQTVWSPFPPGLPVRADL